MSFIAFDSPSPARNAMTDTISMVEYPMRSETLTGSDRRPWRSVSKIGIGREKGASDAPAQLESALLQDGG
jgi:hypothetical protein